MGYKPALKHLPKLQPSISSGFKLIVKRCYWCPSWFQRWCLPSGFVVVLSPTTWKVRKGIRCKSCAKLIMRITPLGAAEKKICWFQRSFDVRLLYEQMLPGGRNGTVFLWVCRTMRVLPLEECVTSCLLMELELFLDVFFLCAKYCFAEKD